MADNGTTIDKLQIEIEATAQSTSQVFSMMLSQLSSLKTALTSLNAGQISKIQKQLSSLSSTVSKTSSVSVNTSGMSKSERDISNSVSKIKQSLAGLESYKNAALSGDSSSLTSFNRRVISIQSSVDVLTSKLKDLGDTRVQSTEFVNLENQINTTRSKLDELETQMKNLPTVGGTSSDAYTQLQTEIQTTKNELDGLMDKQREMLDSGSAYTDPFEGYRNSLESMKDDLLSTKNEVASAVGEMNSQNISIGTGDVVSRIREVGSEALSAASSLLKMSSSAIKSGFSSIKNKLSSIKSTLTSIGSSASSGVSTGFSKILKYAFGIRSMYVLFRRLRTAIKDAFTELQESGANVEETTANVNALKTALYTLKYQFGAAFEPIFNTVAPALETMINYLVAAMNTISAFIAKITGASTYSKAVVTMNSVSDSASGASSAVDDLNKQLQGFDELNNLSGDSDSGSGGSGSSSSDDYDVTYVEESVESALSSFWNTLADYIEAGDWYMVGNTISTALSNALDNIDWPSIWSTVSDWGTNLASFMNGLITDELFTSIGTTIGNSIKTALTFLNSFGDEFDFTNFGNSIASGINAYVETNPLSLAVETFNTWATGILDTLIAAIGNIDWSQIATNIADAIGNIKASEIGEKMGTVANELANALYTLVSNKDTWSNLGTKISDGINGFFSSMNSIDSKTGKSGWSALGSTISNVFTGFGDMIVTALNNTDWVAVGQGIADFISGIDWEQIKFTFGNLLSALKTAIIDLIKGLDITPTDLVGVTLAITGIAVTLTLGSIAASITKQAITTAIATKIASLFGGSTAAAAVSEGTAVTVTSGASLTLTIAQVALAAGLGWKLGNAIDDFLIANGIINDQGFIDAHNWIKDNGLLATINDIRLYFSEDCKYSAQYPNVLRDNSKNEFYPKSGKLVRKDGKATYYISEIKLEAGSSAMKFTNSASFDSILKSAVEEKGGELGEGFQTGFVNKATDSEGWKIPMVRKSIEDEISDEFEINSPAKTMYPYGSAIVEGIRDGISLNSTSSMFSTAISGVKTMLDSLLSANGLDDVDISISATLATGVNTLKSWGGSFVENITDKWTDTKSTISAVLGGDIEDNGISTFTSWITGISNLQSAWTSKSATFKANTGGQISRITDLGSWQSTITNLTTAWQSKKAEFTAKYGSGTSETSINTMKTTISNLVSSWVSKATTYAASYANGTTESKITGMKNAISGLVGAWVSKDTTYKASYANGTTETGINGMKSVISGLTGAWVSKSASFSSTFNQTKETMQGYADAITAIKNNWTGASASFSISASIDTSNFDEIATTLANAVKTKLSGSTTYKMNIYKELGGILSNGTWKSIPQYAGGSLNAGSLFWAGEGGSPELVGHMNGRTEVLNKSQIASVMYASMTNAMRNFGSPTAPPTIRANGSVGTYNPNNASGSNSDALLMEQNRLIAQQNVLLERIAEKDTTISANDIFSAMRVESNNYYNRTGNSAFIGF